jgi:hypothetical protein
MSAPRRKNIVQFLSGEAEASTAEGYQHLASRLATRLVRSLKYPTKHPTGLAGKLILGRVVDLDRARRSEQTGLNNAVIKAAKIGRIEPGLLEPVGSERPGSRFGCVRPKPLEDRAYGKEDIGLRRRWINRLRQRSWPEYEPGLDAQRVVLVGEEQVIY